MKAAENQKNVYRRLECKAEGPQAELFNLRFQLAINQLENPMRISAVKKDIAASRPSCARTRSKMLRMRNGREG